MAHNLLNEIEIGSKNGLLKKRIITHYMHNGSSTIPDLARELNLSVPTVTKFINEMCDDGYINDYGKLETVSGRHPSLYGLNPESGYFIGVDIKKFTLNIGLMNFKGDMVDLKMNIPYKFKNTAEGLEELCVLVREFIRETGIETGKILNVNLNISGRVNPESGYSFSTFNFSERPLAEVLREKIGCNVCIDNDTRAMTYGELVQGCVKGEKDILFVNISWGLGIGIIIDGKIYTGKSGFSGEFGHVNAFDNEILCHCGKKGCIETELSGSAICRKLIERIHNHEASVLSRKVWGGNVITIADIIAAAEQEDPLCIELVSQVGSELGHQLAGLINLLNPDCIVIGGKIAEVAPYYFLQPVTLAIHKYSLRLMNQHLSILPSRLGQRAGIVGACMLARKRLVWDRLLGTE